MPLTNFPNGISSFGNPVFGGSMSFPISGSTGTAFFVDPARGSDGNNGKSFNKPLATVTKALSLATDKAGDVIYLMNDGNTSGTSRDSATITWSKDNTHLIGLCAPTMISQRSRISPPTSATSIVTPQLTVSGHGCVFANISLFEGTSEDSVASECVRVTGNRNYFYNVAMMNMGDAANGHSGDEANSCHLKISGGEENTFERCYIGLDTAARSTTNANVELVSAATRNVFKDCFFPAYADNAGALFVKVDGASDIDRFVLFERCVFMNSGTSTMTGAMDVHASAGGTVIVKDCGLIGAADWEAADSSVIQLLGAAPNAVTTGIAVDVDVTA
jgi:hypothetical protein